MNGHDYIALHRLSGAEGDVLAEVGERCDRMPEDSLTWLVEQGHVELSPARIVRTATTGQAAAEGGEA